MASKGLKLLLNETVEMNALLAFLLEATHDDNYDGVILDGISVGTDEITSAINETPKWLNIELWRCEGPMLPWLVEHILKFPRLRNFAIRRLRCELGGCLHGIQLQALQNLRLEASISEQAARYLAEALHTENKCALSRLDLSDSSFETHHAVELLANGLMRNSSVTALVLSHCQLADADIQILVQKLPSTTRSMDLVANFCRADGLAAIATQLLDTERCLESINLTNQHPGERGGALDVSLLATSIISNTSLRELDLSFNLLSTKDVSGLIVSLEKNSTLRTLNLMCNRLNDRTMELIGESLYRMDGLRSLDVSANRFGEAGADALLGGLRNNFGLIELSMPRGFAASDEIVHLLALNLGGRRLWLDKRHESRLPMGLWPFLLARMNRLSRLEPQMKATIVFSVLREALVVL